MSTDRETTSSQGAGAGGPGTDDGSTDGVADDEIPLDKRFAVLKNRRRRRVLEHLRDNGGESTLGDLAEFIGAEENGVERQQLSTTERKRVYVGLYQCHLPTLDDAGAVEFEKRSGEVTLRPAAERLFEHLDRGSDEDADQPAESREQQTGSVARAGLAWAVVAFVGLAALGAVGSAGWPVALAGAGLLAAVETAATLTRA